MSLALTPPEVVGSIDQEYLKLLELPAASLVGASLIEHHTPVYAELARIAGVDLEDEDRCWEPVGRSSIVEPNRSQAKGRGWHYDNVVGFMAADVLPPQFLLGDEDAIRELWGYQERPELKDGVDAAEIAEFIGQIVNYYTDEQLLDADLRFGHRSLSRWWL